MAEPTTTRATVRQAIGKMARMPFFLRYPSSGVVTSTASTDLATGFFTSTSLTQDDNFWQGMWMWLPEAEEERYIASFDAAADHLIAEWPLTAAATEGDGVEIYSLWPPVQIHEAINKSIDQAWRQYPDIVVDQTIIVNETQTIYPSSDWSSVPWKLFQVWLEQNNTRTMGIPTAGAAGSISDTDRDFSTVDTDHFVSIYFGTGVGQLREVSTGTSAGVLSVTSVWTTIPDTTSKYALWDNGDQSADWVRLVDYRIDAPEFPDNLYLPYEPVWADGLRFRLMYAAKPATLSSDAGTTVIPEQFLVYKSLSILHDSLIGDNRADRQMHASAAEYYDQLARTYMAEAPRRKPSGTLQIDTESGAPSGGGVSRQDNIGDPMGWTRG